jgi:hypothetical protein
VGLDAQGGFLRSKLEMYWRAWLDLTERAIADSRFYTDEFSCRRDRRTDQ